jgi:carboxypeptidase family protein
MKHAPAISALLWVALAAACARAVVTCVNELDIPGWCPPDTVRHGTFQATADSLVGADSVVGLVVSHPFGLPVQNARVTITSDTARVFLTDARGRFAGLRPRTASWTVEARAIGYRPRVDTIHAGVATAMAGGLGLRIGIEVQGTDGPCSGFAMICGKRP